MGFPGFELLLDGFDWREGADFELALEQGFKIGHGREEFFLRGVGHAVGEEDAVEMVGLVLDGAGGQFVDGDLEPLAFEVECLDDDFLGPADIAVELGEREAAFFAGLGSFAADDLGVDEDDLFVFLGDFARKVDDEQAQGEADLVGGQANAFVFVHQLEHAADDGAQVGVDLGDGPRLPTERGMGVMHDVHPLTLGGAGGKGKGSGRAGGVFFTTKGQLSPPRHQGDRVGRAGEARSPPRHQEHKGKAG